VEEKDKKVINRALRILDKYLKRETISLTSPELVRAYLRMRLQMKEREVFAVLVLDNQNRLIEYVELFFGTLDSASVWPREVVKLMLEKNGAACMFVHNHPSGVAQESAADRQITDRLVKALDLIGVRVLDHFIVAGSEVLSFAERGLL